MAQVTAREIWELGTSLGRVRREGVSQNEYDEWCERHGRKWRDIRYVERTELQTLQRERSAMRQ